MSYERPQDFDPAAHAELNRLVDELLDQSVSPESARQQLEQFTRAHRASLPEGAERAYDEAKTTLAAFDAPVPTPNFVHAVVDTLDRRVGFASAADRSMVARLRKGLAAAALLALAAGFVAQRYAPADQPLSPANAAGLAYVNTDATFTDQAAPALQPAVAQTRDQLRSITHEITAGTLPPIPSAAFDFEHARLIGLVSTSTSPQPTIRIIRDEAGRSYANAFFTFNVHASDSTADVTNDEFIQLIGTLDRDLAAVINAQTHTAVLPDGTTASVLFLTTSTEIRTGIESLKDQLPDLADRVVPDGVRWIVLPDSPRDR